MNTVNEKSDARLKVTGEQAEEHRARLIAAARRLFRQHGFQKVSVARISEAAGLTHGAFYSHFSSKNDIEVIAIAAIIEKAAADWREVIRANPGDPLPSLVEGYLTFDHTSDGDTGCAFVALGSEIARGSEELREAASRALPSQIDVLETIFEGDDAPTRRHKAMAAYASLVGAATMAQSLSDRTQIEQICRATAELILRSRGP